MKKIKSDLGSITIFVIVAFLFCMIMLVTIYWASTNNQISVLQSEQRIKEIYGVDVNNVESIYQEIKRKEEESRLAEENRLKEQSSSGINDEPQINDEPNIEEPSGIADEVESTTIDETNNEQNNNL